jgi:hypothetical protein
MSNDDEKIAHIAARGTFGNLVVEFTSRQARLVF